MSLGGCLLILDRGVMSVRARARTNFYPCRNSRPDTTYGMRARRSVKPQSPTRQTAPGGPVADLRFRRKQTRNLRRADIYLASRPSLEPPRSAARTKFGKGSEFRSGRRRSANATRRRFDQCAPRRKIEAGYPSPDSADAGAHCCLSTALGEAMGRRPDPAP